MAFFGRRSARQRLRSAARESLTIPAFSTPVDCSAWVLGGLWPAELATITPETALLADYLNADLQRIANSANDKLHAISRSSLAGQARQTAEARVINVARAFAVLRVESTVRQLRNQALAFGAEYVGLNPAPLPVHPPRAAERAVGRAARRSQPEQAIVDTPTIPETVPEPAPQRPEPSAATESDEQRLRRLLAFVARQEPGLRWAVGTFPDGKTLLVTDLVGGWVPSGIALPAGVRLLEPGRRTGTVTELLGAPTASAAYHPGDRLGWAGDFGATDASVQPRELAPAEDLGRQLGDATLWRDGVPRMANTLVKAGAAGDRVADDEIDLLRVHLDTLRYQLLAQYPDVDRPLVLNCMLLAATEGIATGDDTSANYHYSWFRALGSPQTDR